MKFVQVHESVSEAIEAGKPVVALESTVYSLLGLPAPFNEEALRRCVAALESHDVVPALTAVVDGVARVGVEAEEYGRVLEASQKVSLRDLPVATAERWPLGVTTVSASLSLAAKAGVAVFATGGIGGVHRETEGDVSADLPALARYPLLTVCAGAKAFLDLEATLEYLETLGVPVVGWQTKEFPAFFTESSGIPLMHSASSFDSVACILRNLRRLGDGGGAVLGVAPPQPLDRGLVEAVIDEVLSSSLRPKGHEATPYILRRIAEETQGRSVEANVALVERNCDVAAQVAVAYSALLRENSLIDS